MLYCYITAMLVGLLVSLVELLSRYGAGNNPRWVLLGKPQVIYYAINIATAGLGLFISETLQQSFIAEIYNKNLELALLKSAGVGLASMFALRSSLFTVKKKDDKTEVDLGPAQMLNIVNRYLERQIDQLRGTSAINELADLMDDSELEILFPDLPAICVVLAESVPKEDIERMRQELDQVISNKDWKSPRAQAFAMALIIQREVGAVTLLKTVETLKKLKAKTSSGSDSDRQQKQEERFGNMLESIDHELDLELEKLVITGKGGIHEQRNAR